MLDKYVLWVYTSIMNNKLQENLIKIAPNRYISVNALNKKKPFTTKRIGRPKQSDYLLDDITPAQRARLNKNPPKPVTYRMVRNRLSYSVRIIAGIIIVLMLVGWACQLSSRVAEAEVSTDIMSPVAKSNEWKVTMLPPVIPSYCRGEINSLFCKYTDWDAKKMIAICMSENGFKMWGNKWNPEVQYSGNDNGSVDTGLCMINSVHGYDAESLKIPAVNVEAAHKIWVRRPDYRAWSDFNNGRWLAYYEGL